MAAPCVTPEPSTRTATRPHQCGHLTPDTWNHVTVNLATHSANKQITRLLVGYDHPGGTGGYRGYVDNIAISEERFRGVPRQQPRRRVLAAGPPRNGCEVPR